MKYLLLRLIKIYWRLIPTENRRMCIFRISCSRYVFQETESGGFLTGIEALRYRFQNCRRGFEIFDNPIDGTKQLILKNGDVLKESEIAERFLSAPPRL